jgi:hypothetical protein
MFRRPVLAAALAACAGGAVASDAVPRCTGSPAGHAVARPSAMPTLALAEGVRLGRDRQGALQVWTEVPGAYLSPDLGIIAIAPDGAECALPLAIPHARGAVISRGVAAVAAVEVGLCSNDGCLPVRLDVPPLR